MSRRTEQDVIAGNIQRLREKLGLSQRGLAALVHEHGLPWIQATVAAVETGRRQVSVAELLLLQFALEPLPQLLRAENKEDIEIEAAVVTARELRDLASGHPGKRPGRLTVGADLELRWATGDLERRAAVRLGDRLDRTVAAREVTLASRSLYGHSLEEERASRAETGPGDQRIRLGHATRALLDELELHMRKGK